MSAPPLTGLFGKLPAHGDFVHRNLPANFITVWDQWLQGFVGGSQEQLGETWLDIYLTSPIWRFVFSAGVIDEHQWAGVMLPSVDKVGRYFPFSMITKIRLPTNPMEFISTQADWFGAVEQACLDGLDGELDIDTMIAEINRLEQADFGRYDSHDNANMASKGVVIDMDFDEREPANTFPYLLDAFIARSWASYSTWSTSGSELVHPCTFVSQGLPEIGRVAAMLDGQWSQWQWQQPHLLKFNDDNDD